MKQLDAATPLLVTPLLATPLLATPLLAQLADRPVGLLLDYDGTLVDLAETPDAAAPDADLLLLLGRLSRARGVFVHMISGRPRPTMEAWLGALEVGLHAEHGVWSRWSPRGEWQRRTSSTASWFERLRPVMEAVTDRFEGSLLEVKTESLAWHHRHVVGDVSQAERIIRDAASAAGPDATLLAGHAVLEVRRRGIDKGAVVREVRAAHPDALLVAFGDDVTDEDMFAALPDDGVAVGVGPTVSRCAHRLGRPADVRRWLGAIVGVRGEDGDRAEADRLST